jgi:hypothetical protein
VIPLGLSASGLAQLNTALASSHSISISVYVLNMAGAKMADLSQRFLDGQVNVNATADVTRSCTLSLLDPERSLQFDSDSPSDGAIYVDRMIQVNYSVRSPTMSQVTIPVFTGPLVKMARTDDVVNLEAQGKESLGMGMVWSPRTYTKGWRKVDVIMSILQTRAGETKFSFPELAEQLPGNYSIGRENTPWGVAKNVATGMGLHLFYDGRGVARLERYPQTSAFHFKTGDGGTVMTTPDVTYSTENLKNTILVKGAVPKGGKTPIEYAAFAPASHPLSPWRLGRNGIPRYLVEIIENSSVTSLATARELAERVLRDRLLQEVEVKFDALPIPHLEESDVVRVYTDEFNNAFRLNEFSIPLTTKGLMSVGYRNRVSVQNSKLLKGRR